MLTGQKEIQQQIELKRAELNKLAELHGVQDKKVLEKSRELDELLNKFKNY